MDNREKLRKQGIKDIYYYDKTEHGIVTICLLVEPDGVKAKGRSLCSPKDQFVKVTGRHKALGMAYRAADRGVRAINEGHPLVAEDLVPLKRGVPELGFKGIFCPYLTDFEKKITRKVPAMY